MKLNIILITNMEKIFLPSNVCTLKHQLKMNFYFTPFGNVTVNNDKQIANTLLTYFKNTLFIKM